MFRIAIYLYDIRHSQVLDQTLPKMEVFFLFFMTWSNWMGKIPNCGHKKLLGCGISFVLSFSLYALKLVR